MTSFKYLSVVLLANLFFLAGCGDDDAPAAENEEEVINEIVLTFTPAGSGTPKVFSYVDPDGEGTEAPTQEDIVLSSNTIYTLEITLKNTVGTNNEDISEEVKAEGQEHQFFFAWTGQLFQNPTGLGNIGAGNQDKDLQYVDKDVNGLPIGLTTLWETAEPASGTFRLMLKHQPGIKTASTSSEDGETDLDITWNILIE